MCPLCARNVSPCARKVSPGARRVSHGAGIVFHSARKVSYGAGKVSYGAGKVSYGGVKVSHGAGKVSTDYFLLSESFALQESIIAFKKRFFKLLGPGVLAKSNTEKGPQLTHSVPISTRRQPSNPRLRFRLLDFQLVDIGMKLHLVHFAVKFSSASASETKSNQVGLSPISSQPRLATLDSVDFRLDLGRLGWN